MKTYRLLPILLILALAGCQVLRPTPLVGASQEGAVTTVQSVSDRSVQGRVDFTSGRAAQAVPADVVNAATVSFIDTGTNQTVATGKTDAAGSFSLTLGSYTPVNGGTYLLEAVKGLNAQAPGSDAARFRTILQWNGTSWLSCTNDSVPGSIVINALTTALAIETALDPANVPAAVTIGKVNVGTSPATLNAAPGPYTNHPDSEISQLAADLLSYLGVDADPLASVPAIAPSISSFQPASAGSNYLVRIVGSGFSPVPSGNTVTFNGVSAQVLLATPTSLVVVVPSGATSGTLRVVTGRGAVNSGTPFTLAADIGSLAIASVTPASARAGDLVTIGGQFGSVNGAVTLGSLRCTIASASPTSITFKVPFGATSAPVSYQVGTSTATSAQVLGIKPGNIGAFVDVASASTLPTLTYYANGLDHNGSVYMIGGHNARTGLYMDRVLRARYLADGSLGPWQHVGTMTAASYVHAVFIRNNVLYVVGGRDNTAAYLSRVERASFNADGTLGPFTIAGNLITPRHAHTASLVNDRLYVIGGYNATGHLSSIERGAFDGAGNLSFAAAGSVTLSGTPTTVYAASAVVAGSTILLLAVYRDGAYGVASKQVIRIPVLGDGSLGVMSLSAKQLPEAKTHCFPVVVDGKVYLPGGLHLNADSTWVTFPSVLVATLDTVNGDIDSVTSYANRAVIARYGAPTSYHNNRLYVHGGIQRVASGADYPNATSEAMNLEGGAVDYAQILGTMRPRHGHEVVVVGSNAYIIGGYSNQLATHMGQVERVSLNPDGTLGVPVPVSTLATPRRFHGAIAIGNYLYVMGGGTSTVLSSIERAMINPDGSLKPFVTLTDTALPTALSGISPVRIGNWLYVVGGDLVLGVGVSQPHTYRAPINPDDSIGRFEICPAATLPEGRSYAKSVVIGDYLYVFGGFKTAGSADVLRSPIAPDGSLLGFERCTPFSVPRHFASTALIGSYLYVFGAWASDANKITVERAPVTGNGDLGAWEASPPMLVSRGHTGVAVYQDRLFLFGGEDLVASTSSIETAVIN